MKQAAFHLFGWVLNWLFIKATWKSFNIVGKVLANYRPGLDMWCQRLFRWSFFIQVASHGVCRIAAAGKRLPEKQL